jgi:hypothetical protein
LVFSVKRVRSGGRLRSGLLEGDLVMKGIMEFSRDPSKFSRKWVALFYFILFYF